MHSFVWKCSYKDITLIFTSIKWKFLFCTVRYPHMIPLNYSQEKYVVTTLSLSLSSTHYESAHLDILEEGTKSGYWMWNEIFLQKEFELLSNICTYTIWIVYVQEMQQNGKNTINIYCCFIDHRYCQNVAICFIYIL